MDIIIIRKQKIPKEGGIPKLAWGCFLKSPIMGKRKEFNFVGHAHELTFSCYKNQSFLSNEIACRNLASAIIRARDKHFFELWVYVFMPNHVHLLIYPKTKNYSIAKILASIKQPVSRKMVNYLKRYNPDGLQSMATGQRDAPYRFWQDGGGYDRNIISCEALAKTANYIHNNPVSKGLVNMPEEWNWSSAKDWISAGHGPIEIDRCSFAVL